MNCTCCNKPLKDSIRTGGFKSCPRCSQNNSKHVHIFYPESDFGTTTHRITPNNHDGIQSHCTECRGDNVNPNGIECCDMKQQ